MKEIKLSQCIDIKYKKLNLVALVDDEDYEYLSQWNWHVVHHGRTYYAARKSRSKIIFMHRVVMGASKDQLLDHKDRRGYNNQKPNLRFCNVSQNNMNRSHTRGRHTNAGVRLRKYKPKKRIKSWLPKKPLKEWTASITAYNKRKSLGGFYNEREAAIAYNIAAFRLHGEFASLNKVGLSEDLY